MAVRWQRLRDLTYIVIQICIGVGIAWGAWWGPMRCIIGELEAQLPLDFGQRISGQGRGAYVALGMAVSHEYWGLVAGWQTGVGLG